MNGIKSILLTGACGFIGARTAELLLAGGYEVTGVDNMNDYYDIRLKRHRLDGLKPSPGFSFMEMDIEDRAALGGLFSARRFDAVMNLAARAGVRYSITDPYVYMRTNLMGTLNLLELAREHGVGKFVLASTSSLYAGSQTPFSEDLPVNNPISPYAASKKAAEVTAYTYHYLYSMDVTVLRYFTVYGPAGRPDMSYFRFIKLIDEGQPVKIYGDGSQSRDFTYIDDIALGTIKALGTKTGYEIINLGGNKPHTLNRLLELIEKALGKKALKLYEPFHKADMKATWADIKKAEKILFWQPAIGLKEGIERTIGWHRANRGWLSEIRL